MSRSRYHVMLGAGFLAIMCLMTLAEALLVGGVIVGLADISQDTADAIAAAANCMGVMTAAMYAFWLWRLQKKLDAAVNPGLVSGGGAAAVIIDVCLLTAAFIAIALLKNGVESMGWVVLACFVSDLIAAGFLGAGMYMTSDKI